MIKRKINIQQQIDAVNQAASQALASAQSAQAVAQGTATARPIKKPDQLFDFSNSKFLDPRFTVQRTTIGSFYDKYGDIKFSDPNKPRFQHDPLTGQCLGLLVEDTKKNILVYSENFINPWVNDNISISAGGSFFRDYNSTRVLETNGTAIDPRLSYAVNDLVVGKQYSFSIFTRYIEGSLDRYLQVNFNSGFSSEIGAIFDVKTGRVLTTNGFSAKVRKLRYGIYRCVFTTTPAVATSGGLRIRITNTSTTSNILNPQAYNTTTSASGFDIFGAQLEEGLHESSYMPTYGSTFQRGSDYFNISSNFFAQVFPGAVDFNSGVTVYMNAMKAYKRYSGEFRPYWRFSVGSGNYFSLSDNPSGSIYSECWKDGIQTFNNYALSIDDEIFFKHVLALKRDDSISYCDGTKLGLNDLSVDIPLNMTQFWIGNGISTVVKQLAFWNNRLTDTELQSLTSSGLSGKEGNQVPSVSDLGGCAFINPHSILSTLGTQLLTIDGKGLGFNIQRNIKFPFDFNFKIIDSSGCTLIATPPSSCGANTESPLIFHAPEGKSLTYQITPIFDL